MRLFNNAAPKAFQATLGLILACSFNIAKADCGNVIYPPYGSGGTYYYVCEWINSGSSNITIEEGQPLTIEAAKYAAVDSAGGAQPYYVATTQISIQINGSTVYSNLTSGSKPYRLAYTPTLAPGQYKIKATDGVRSSPEYTVTVTQRGGAAATIMPALQLLTE
jgi:hypothetical protein